MQCPNCQHTESRVLESRPAEMGSSVRRRRECLNCQTRFTTYERIELIPITVLKRDGAKEAFSRSKLLHGITRACEKTVLSSETITLLVDDVELNLQQCSGREVSSQEIGELVLERLARLNEVAYVRFASVYRKFEGIRDFTETLAHIQVCEQGSLARSR
ncbi:MAG: transcriptional regulator NrdR [Aphanocapsa feldmannii 277cV]|uniref:Transcriptional repressor NrdR n=2 Tax=Aphanocapsa feldmannii TaxID=192050 RepID=A0A524RMN0_9CHRO|nr:MAG: transcriptional regulator NrdR [Aphanocapsa feldmannii 288cV]TGG91898.1 MAG: transcriptional regulator NrdR [Aphanocapsa feldmannii 277cV]TGH20342.1 MAG: transcriptional regulator NrdR [Aphanocapsa feldmannii 277cI]